MALKIHLDTQEFSLLFTLKKSEKHPLLAHFKEEHICLSEESGEHRVPLFIVENVLLSRFGEFFT